MAEGLEESGELYVGDALVFDEEGVDQSGVEFTSPEIARFAIDRCTVVDECECVVEFGEKFGSGT